MLRPQLGAWQTHFFLRGPQQKKPSSEKPHPQKQIVTEPLPLGAYVIHNELKSCSEYEYGTAPIHQPLSMPTSAA